MSAEKPHFTATGTLGRILDQQARELSDLKQELDDVRSALTWALTYIYNSSDEPQKAAGDEVWEDYSGATRIAWPDNPEEWA